MTVLQDFGTDSPNVVAACQQLALCACVYQNDRKNAEKILHPEGEILAWANNVDTWPPSFAILRSGGARYFIVIEGTTNFKQGFGHALGSFIRSKFVGESSVNGAWANAMIQVAGQADMLLPPNLPSGDLYFSGHSYGAAVANVLCVAMAYAHERRQGKVLTFGEPKAFMGPNLIYGPLAHWRYASNGDPVQFIPLDSYVPLVPTWEVPIDWETERSGWFHVGNLQTLYPGGTINVPEPPPDPLPPGVSEDLIEQHLLRNYWGRLGTWNQRFGT